MIAFKLYQTPYPQPFYEFTALAPFLSKFKSLDAQGEAAATRELVAAMDKNDREAMQAAAITVVGAQDFDLSQHRAFALTRRGDDSVHVQPIPEDA